LARHTCRNLSDVAFPARPLPGLARHDEHADQHQGAGESGRTAHGKPRERICRCTHSGTTRRGSEAGKVNRLPRRAKHRTFLASINFLLLCLAQSRRRLSRAFHLKCFARDLDTSCRVIVVPGWAATSPEAQQRSEDSPDTILVTRWPVALLHPPKLGFAVREARRKSRASPDCSPSARKKPRSGFRRVASDGLGAAAEDAVVTVSRPPGADFLTQSKFIAV
jgi:hypothetical protein